MKLLGKYPCICESNFLFDFRLMYGARHHKGSLVKNGTFYIEYQRLEKKPSEEGFPVVVGIYLITNLLVCNPSTFLKARVT